MLELVYSERIIHILLRLFNGESVTCKSLTAALTAGEPKDLRLIQEDMKRIREIIKQESQLNLELIRKGHRFQLNTSSDRKVIAEFLERTGLADTIKLGDTDILQVISEKDDKLKLQSRPVQSLSENSSTVYDIFRAIESRKQVTVYHSKKDKVYTLNPYQIVQYNEIWYLAAVHDEILKSFRLADLKSKSRKGEKFIWKSRFANKIKQSESIWYGKKTKAVVRIDASQAYFFKRREILPHQGEMTENSDGTWDVKCEYSNERQFVPIIQYWMPYARVIKPKGLHEKICNDLRAYLLPNS